VWPLFFTPALNFCLGWLISGLFSMFFKLDKSFSYTVKCAICFGNLGNLMIVLLKGACSSYGPLSGQPECEEAISYISIQLLTYNPLAWSIGTSYLLTGKKHYNRLIEDNISDYQVPLWKIAVKNLLLPAPIACFVGFLAALVPGFQDFLFSKNSGLYCFSLIGLEVGLAGVVLGQTSLGSNLVLLGVSEISLCKRLIFWVVVFKCMLMPLIALALVYFVWIIGIFGNNIVMTYIIYISFCTPTAISILIISENLSHGLKDLTWLLLGIYTASLPSIVVFSYVFFLIIH
jgi:predicted permease